MICRSCTIIIVTLLVLGMSYAPHIADILRVLLGH